MSEQAGFPAACCGCGTTDRARVALVALPYRAPVPGTGWGCIPCDLPNDGAIGVACSWCVDHGSAIEDCVVGYALESAELVGVDGLDAFEHVSCARCHGFPMPCSRCNGSGLEHHPACAACRGSGLAHSPGPNKEVDLDAEPWCSACGGTGEEIR